MALTLTLKPQERAILGGAVVRNAGTRSARLLVETEVPVLRQADVLTRETAKTPCSRLYLVVQLLYLDPSKFAALECCYLELAKDVVSAAPSLKRTLERLSLAVAAGDYYRALREAKRLREAEKALLTTSSEPRIWQKTNPASNSCQTVSLTRSKNQSLSLATNV